MFAALAQKRSAALIQLSRSMSRSRCNLDTEPPCRVRPTPKGPSCNKPISDEACVPPVVEKSFWESGCCEHPCANALPRLDNIYYKKSDKAKRRYHQTWVECPSPIKKTKISCCFDDTLLPPIEKRPRDQRPKTACNMMKTQDCTLAKKPKCVRVSLPGCRSRRNTFHCLVDKNPSAGCPSRECAPYPSFSECIRCRPGPLHKKECGCVFDPAQCDIYKEMERWLWLKMKPTC